MKRILIVEDDVDLCLCLSDLLGEFGFETAVACNGAKALLVLADADPLPDVILLDLHMPHMDGWQLREVLRANPRYASIPIVVMSGDKAATDMDAAAHLMKPFEEADLHGILGQVLLMN